MKLACYPMMGISWAPTYGNLLRPGNTSSYKWSPRMNRGMDESMDRRVVTGVVVPLIPPKLFNTALVIVMILYHFGQSIFDIMISSL